MKQIKLIPIGRYNILVFMSGVFVSYIFAIVLLPEAIKNNEIFSVISTCLIFIVLPTVLIIGTKDQFLVFLYLNQSEIFERVLFKKKRHFQWDEVVDVGIGVNPIQAYKNANFYVSRRPVTEYEIMHVYDMRKDPDVILIRYSKKAYQALKTFCPIEINQDELVPQINKSFIK